MSVSTRLRTGTVNVARYLNRENQSGVVAVGRDADLLLLEANPLDDIGAITRHAGIMPDGRWISPELIATRLAAITAKHVL
jgi:imidazolonepropionase-like amidohydrolase